MRLWLFAVQAVHFYLVAYFEVVEADVLEAMQQVSFLGLPGERENTVELEAVSQD